MFRGNPAHWGFYSGGGPSIIGLQWRVPTNGDVLATPVIERGIVYVGSGLSRYSERMVILFPILNESDHRTLE